MYRVSWVTGNKLYLMFCLEAFQGTIAELRWDETALYEVDNHLLTIHWKQGSFLGMGGDRSQTYYVCQYRLVSQYRYFVTIYAQESYGTPDEMTVDRTLQYGLDDDIVFLVYHDKEQKPFQARFTGSSDSWNSGEYLWDV